MVGKRCEGLVRHVTRDRRRFHEMKTILRRKVPPFFNSDLPIGNLVTLVTHKRYDKVWACIAARELEPLRNTLKTLPPRDVVDEQCPQSGLEKAAQTPLGDVPALQHDRRAPYLDCFGSELQTDMRWLGLPASQTLQQTALTDATVSNDHTIEDPRVGVARTLR